MAVPDDGEVENVRIGFRTYSLVGEEALRDLHYEKRPGEFANLGFRRFQRSISTYRYEGPPVLIFFRPDPEAETGFSPVGRVSISPEDGKSFLVFVLPASAEENDKRVNLEIIEDSFDRIPDNTVSFLNFTNASLVGVLDIVEIQLDRGFSGPFSLHERLGKPVIVGLAVRRGDSVRKVLQNRWTFRAGERNLVILAPPRRPGSFRIQAFHLIDSEERARLGLNDGPDTSDQD